MSTQSFFDKVEQLRWDDHRYYHQSRINQTLHLISAFSFLIGYVALFVDPAVAGLIGWCVGMVSRQSGHIFFEPRGYDDVNETTYEHKETIKVGYNMRRKAVLITLWLSLSALLWYAPGVADLLPQATGAGPLLHNPFLHNLGWLWLAVGVAGVLFRTLHLFFLRGPVWGLAWATKIVTDPFHNIAIYWKSPLALLHGEWLDPMREDDALASRRL